MYSCSIEFGTLFIPEQLSPGIQSFLKKSFPLEEQQSFCKAFIIVLVASQSSQKEGRREELEAFWRP